MNKLMVVLAALGLLAGCANLNSRADINAGNSSDSPSENVAEITADEKNTAQAVENAKQGELLYKEGDYKNAKIQFNEALKFSDKIPMVYYRLGNIAFKESQFAEAERYFNKVVALQPRQSKAYYNLAVIHLMKAEENFKYYTASAREDKPVEPRIIQIMSDIDAFASAQTVPKKANPLDKLAETLMVGETFKLPAK